MSDKTPNSQELQRRLDEVMSHARENEQKNQLFQRMELKLLSKETLVEICGVLVNDYRSAFKVEIVNLLLIDSGKKLSSIFEDQGPASPSIKEHVQFINDFDTLNNLGQLPKQPMLGSYQREQHRIFFSESSAFRIKSVAILPIYRHGLLLGFLSFGSNDTDRYQDNMATDFLERLAMIAAVSIDNVINIEYLRQLGLIDPLTSVFNRRYFFQRLDDEVMRGLRHGHQLACLYIDIDHFKQVNDKYGHAAGDLALLHVTKILGNNIRVSDILARLGGEEFAILLPEVTLQGMQETAERIRSSVEKQACELTTSSEIKMTVSIGMCILDGDKTIGEASDLGEILVKTADNALYQAKEAGRNCIRTFDFTSP